MTLNSKEMKHKIKDSKQLKTTLRRVKDTNEAKAAKKLLSMILKKD